MLTQLGEGKLHALLALGGIALGNWLYAAPLEARVRPETRAAKA